MTAALFAATGSFRPGSEAQYRPGVCNIGPEEIARRQRAGHVGAIATIIVLAVLVGVGAPPFARAILVIPAAGAAVGFLQAAFRFCAGFGARGVFNFGPVGETDQVQNDEARARDRAMANRIFLASLSIGIVVAVVAVLLPI